MRSTVVLRLLERKKYFLFALLYLCYQGAIAQGRYQERLMVPYNLKGKWGYSDTLGNILISPKYDSVARFREHISTGPIAFVYRRGKLGAISKGGRRVIPPKFDTIGYLKPSYDLSYFWLKKDGKEFVYSIDGKKLATADKIYFSRYSYPVIGLSNKGHSILLNLETQEKTSRGQYPFKMSNDMGIRFKHGDKYLNNSITLQAPDGSLEFITTDTTFYFSPRELEAFERKRPISKRSWPRKSRLFRYRHEIEKLKEQYRLDSVNERKSISSLGKLALTYLYGYRDGVVVIIDVFKKEEVQFEVDHIHDIYEYWFQGSIYAEDPELRVLFLVEKDDKFGILRRDGKIIVPIEYDSLEMENDRWRRFLFLEKDGKYGLKYMWEKDMIVKPQYDSIEYGPKIATRPRCVLFLFKVEKEGQYGFIGMDGIEYFKF